MPPGCSGSGCIKIPGVKWRNETRNAEGTQERMCEIWWRASPSIDQLLCIMSGSPLHLHPGPSSLSSRAHWQIAVIQDGELDIHILADSASLSAHYMLKSSTCCMQA